MGFHIAWDGPRIYLEILVVAVAAYFAIRAMR